jgi:hypothetical protein
LKYDVDGPPDVLSSAGGPSTSHDQQRDTAEMRKSEESIEYYML